MNKSKYVLVINCGSSSVKFAVLDNKGVSAVVGVAECIGEKNSSIKYTIFGEKKLVNINSASHEDVISFIVENIFKNHDDLLKNICAVGHRVVHGGEDFSESTIIDPSVIDKIEKCINLAPLHNPAHLIGIRSAQKFLPELPQIAVFDTAFHQDMPRVAFMYSIPALFYNKHNIRRYGMHGTSHKYVSELAASALGLDLYESNFISCHLGNGASVCAIKKGKSVDTSMGFTPLEGLTMGTRSGDIDPSIIFHLVNNLAYSLEDIQDILNSKSGLLGLSGLTSDCRGIEEAVAKNHDGAILALDVFCYKLAKYIASYFVPLVSVDALIFTGGIGENSELVRAKVISNLRFLNYAIDSDLNSNACLGNSGVITKKDTPVAMVVNTNEELVIAQDSFRLSGNEI